MDEARNAYGREIQWLELRRAAALRRAGRPPVARLIGFGQLDAKTAEIRALYVHPDYARQNIGSFLLMLLEAKADSADVPRFTVNAPLNAVAFFRAREFTELGPASIPLADGTSLPGVKMVVPRSRRALPGGGDRGGHGPVESLILAKARRIADERSA